MKVGLTYDLRDDYLNNGFSFEETAEFDSIDTIDAIAGALRELGYTVDCIGHARELTRRLVAGERWDLVFNIAEGLYGTGREALVPALLDAYRIPYVFSGPVTMAVTLDKSIAKRLVRDQGIPTAPFTIVRSMHDLRQFALTFPVFAKPLAEGTGKGVSSSSYIQTLDELHQHCDHLLTTFRQPVLVETYLSGREFTVGLIGNQDKVEVVGVMEVSLSAQGEKYGYTLLNKEHFESNIHLSIVDDAEAKRAADTALRAWHALGCDDCARFDLRSDGHGIPHFLEVNPIAGLNPERSDLILLQTMQGVSYLECIRRIMRAATKRLHLPAPHEMVAVCAS